MIVIVIPAKAASSRLPNKNMRDLNGRPMIDYSIRQARQSKRANAVWVTTDSEEIADHVAAQGVDVVRRSTALGGDVPLFDVYRHAAETIGIDEIDVLIGLQVDHPDRTVGVDEAMKFFEESGADYLTSSEADGTVNGAYKIYTRAMLKTGEPTSHVVLVDDCTNIHYAEDLAKASERLSAQDGS